MKSALTALLVACTLTAAAINGEPTATAPESCESLTSLTLPTTTITLAQSVNSGAFTPPMPAGGAAAPPAAAQGFHDLPAFCRMAATLKPSSDSDIKIEVWMPASDWNGKFQAVGNGGWAGSIRYAEMADALRRGYATSATDTGHIGSGESGSFALGHPEKQIDLGYRSEHEMTVNAKAIIVAFYGNGPRLSYWNGCSTGGRQGLREAQSYPDDYDGIIAGAPANPVTHLAGWGVYVGQIALKDRANYIPASKYTMIHRAVVAACDALDGVKDGLIDDPMQCTFDFKALQCRGDDGPSCLTAPQVETAGIITRPAINSSTGELIYPGLSLGSELGWATKTGGPERKGMCLLLIRQTTAR
jgi:feruloyl esterase